MAGRYFSLCVSPFAPKVTYSCHLTSPFSIPWILNVENEVFISSYLFIDLQRIWLISPDTSFLLYHQTCCLLPDLILRTNPKASHVKSSHHSYALPIYTFKSPSNFQTHDLTGASGGCLGILNQFLTSHFWRMLIWYPFDGKNYRMQLARKPSTK